MTQLYASVAIGTIAAVLAIILVVLRAKVRGRRPLLVLMRQWAATGPRTSALTVGLLTAIAAVSFAQIPAHELRDVRSASAGDLDDTSSDANVLQDLRSYVGEIDSKRHSMAAEPPGSVPSDLQDVDTMIAKLHARLEKQPDDVKGWKMLGWSYLNMDRAEEAARAYETALKLAPSDIEIRKGLEAAQAPKSLASQTPLSDPSHPTSIPTAQRQSVAVGQPAPEDDKMIRGMVDQLSTRLERSPNDEDGWLQLMRSRMTLGEKSAAKAALTKALETFASNTAATERLTAAARDLGVESN